MLQIHTREFSNFVLYRKYDVIYANENDYHENMICITLMAFNRPQKLI